MNVKDKVLQLFADMVGERAHALDGSHPTAAAADVLKSALLDEQPAQRAADIAFHMTDWNSDAAFVVAVLLFPERFSPDELREGARSFLIHAPNHVAAAAKLGGWPVRDIFGVDALSGDTG